MAMFAPPENCGPSSLATICQFNRVSAHEKEGLLFLADWLGHFDRIERLLQFFFRQHFLLASDFANGAAGFRALLRNLCGEIVTNLWSEARDHGHGKLDELAATLFVCNNSAHAPIPENIDQVCK